MVAKPRSESHLFIGKRIIRLLHKETKGKLTRIFLGILSVPTDIHLDGNGVERYGLEEMLRSANTWYSFRC